MADEARNKLIPTPREVIANKLLTALDDADRVAILATKEDLDLLTEALEYAANEMVGSDSAKLRQMFQDYSQLRKVAFGE